MVNRRTSPLALLLFHIGITVAAPPITLPSSETPNLSLINASSEAISGDFPRGRPVPFDYTTDLSLKLVPSAIYVRSESDVRKIIGSAIELSISSYRPDEPMSRGQEWVINGETGEDFYLGVNLNPGLLPGQEPLTWGRWLDALLAVRGYVAAYPGYDLKFELWVTPNFTASDRYQVGAGWATTAGAQIRQEWKQAEQPEIHQS